MEAPSVKCASNLHQLGLAVRSYTQQYQGNYPDTLETLILITPSISPEVLICPETADTAATGATTQAVQTSLQQPGHDSYTYLGKGMNTKTLPANAVIACEAHSNHHNGMNVLFGDGHVQWADSLIAIKILAKIAATSRPLTLP